MTPDASTMVSVAVGLAALAVTLLGALIVTVWKAASIVTTLTALVGTMQAEITALKAGLERLNTIPLHEQRIGQLEQLVKSIPALLSRVATLEQRVGSVEHFKAVQVAGAMRAASGSKPFIPREEPENDTA